MATILPQPLSRSKAKVHSIKVDMTPMVDLGFLLITFFVFTTSMAKPTITKLTMPTDGEGTIEVTKSKLLTLLIDNQKVFAYEGLWEEANASGAISPSNYHLQNGVGKLIREKQALLAAAHEKDDLMIAIKPCSSASYQDVINALDEMKLNDVKRYGIMQLSAPEEAYLLSQR
jgi:biopolymer transport protein ExbD